MPTEVKARCINANMGKAGTGSLQCVAEFYVKSKGRCEGMTVRHYFNFSGKAAPISAEQMALCGWDGDLKNMLSMQARDVRLVMDEEQVNGTSERTRWKVLRINPLVSELVKPENAASSQELDSMQMMLESAGIVRRPERTPGEEG